MDCLIESHDENIPLMKIDITFAFWPEGLSPIIPKPRSLIQLQLIPLPLGVPVPFTVYSHLITVICK